VTFVDACLKPYGWVVLYDSEAYVPSRSWATGVDPDLGTRLGDVLRRKFAAEYVTVQVERESPRP
jgi:hypothetical protein